MLGQPGPAVWRATENKKGNSIRLNTLPELQAARSAPLRCRGHIFPETGPQAILAFDEILCWSVRATTRCKASATTSAAAPRKSSRPHRWRTIFPPDESLPERIVPPQRRHELRLAVKEALHNILTHARATRVEVQCTMDGGTFVVRVADNGCGSDPQTVAAAPSGGQGHGLENMRRRLAELGGSCHLESRPGDGTRITFRLPLD